jgi:hypothetical protein
MSGIYIELRKIHFTQFFYGISRITTYALQPAQCLFAATTYPSLTSSSCDIS